MPIGLGLFGAALQYHLHFMVLAVGGFLITLSSHGAAGPTNTYLVESFRDNPQEVGTALNIWRVSFGFVIPFFIDAWEAQVGTGWVFGIAAFLNLFATCLVFILMWKGSTLRKLSLLRPRTTEDGVHIR